MAIDRDTINRQIDETTAEIEATLWSESPDKMERAKLLISKRMGLRIVLGEVAVKLKPPPVFVESYAIDFASLP